jgi:acetylornithine deacetylase/succinyl-diaminopimelate desuccinylase-like protein
MGEKGTAWCKLRVNGTAGHASQPFRTDNALVTAAEVVRRIHEFRPPTVLHDVWRRFIESMGYPDELTAPLLREEGFIDVCQSLPLGMGRQFHACTHTTMAPTIVHGGTKINVIPDTVDVELDVRTLPGQRIDDVYLLLDEAIGDLRDSVDIVRAHDDPATASPIETPLWDALSRVTQTFYEGSATVPFLTVGATDARFFRRAGATAYGFGLFSTRLSLEDYGVMFHGDDERVDVESLRLSTELWRALAHDFLES